MTDGVGDRIHLSPYGSQFQHAAPPANSSRATKSSNILDWVWEGLNQNVLVQEVGLATGRDHVMARGRWGLVALVAP